MTRLRILYDGREYTAYPGRTADEIREEIATAVGEGRLLWLPVLSGERRGTPATVLVGPGLQIAVVDPVLDDEGDGPHGEAGASVSG